VELCLYLTNMCPALAYVSFKNELSSILDEMDAEKLLVSVKLYNYTANPMEISLVYLLSEYGKTQAVLINDFTIINIVLEAWMKDMKFRNWVIRRLLPFQRFDKHDLAERIREIKYG